MTGIQGPRGRKGEKGNQGNRGEPGADSEPIHPLRWRLLALWIVIFTFFTVLALQKANDAATKAKNVAISNRHLAQENKELLKAIQESRVSSCTRTYTVIQAILTESVNGRTLDAVGREKLENMRELANPDNCVAQTSVDDDG